MKVLEFPVIALYQHLVIGSVEVVSPLIHNLPDCWTLPIAHIVVQFGRRAFLSVEIDWQKIPKPIVLIEDASDRKAACISLQDY